jgi:hypothetical protein
VVRDAVVLDCVSVPVVGVCVIVRDSVAVSLFVRDWVAVSLVTRPSSVVNGSAAAELTRIAEVLPAATLVVTTAAEADSAGTTADDVAIAVDEEAKALIPLDGTFPTSPPFGTVPSVPTVIELKTTEEFRESTTSRTCEGTMSVTLKIKRPMESVVVWARTDRDAAREDDKVTRETG